MRQLSDKQFDDMMREKMASYNTHETGDWAGFESLLNDASSTVSDDVFDQKISESMNNYVVQDSGASWDAFEKQLDQIDQEEASAFDDDLRYELNNFSARYNEKHWSLFEYWLNQYEITKSYLFTNKIAEVVIVVLLLFTWGNLSHVLFPAKPETKTPYLAAEFQEKISDSDKTTFQPEMRTNAKLSSVKSNQSDDAQKINAKIEKSLDNNQLITREKKQVLASNKTVQSDTPIPSLKSERNTLTAPIEYSNISETSATQKTETKTVAKSTTEPIILAANDDFNTHIDEVNRISGISKLLVNSIDLSGIDVPTLEAKPRESRVSDFYIKPVLGLGWNRVKTPFDPVYNEKGYNQDILGANAGILVGKDIGNFSFETGFLYASKTYEPRRILEVFRNSDNQEKKGVSLDKIGYNIASLMLNVNYRYNTNKKWKPYISFGSAMHVALQAYYDRSEKDINELGIQALSNARYTDGEQPKLEEKKFNDGLFENGKFKDNYYFSFNVGGGVERIFSERLSLFVQPTLSFNALNKGLGPNNDKIHNLSVLTGLKYRFGKAKNS